MSFDAHKNFGFSTVATAPSPASSGTSLVVATGDGSKFPTPPFNATVSPAGATRAQMATLSEIVRVTAISTDTLTIVRATEGPNAARSIVVGDEIAATITAKTITDIEGTGIVRPAGGGLETISTVATAGSSQTLNLANGNLFDLTLTAATCTISLSGATNGEACSCVVVLRQDGTGGRKVSWPGSVTWIAGTAPTLHTAAGAVDVVTLFTLDGGTTWFGVQGATPVPFQFAETLTTEGTSSSTYADLTTPGPSVTVNVGSSGIVLVGWNFQCDAAAGIASIDVSGANTIAATDNYYLRPAAVNAGAGRTYVFTGLTAGSTTFKMKYRSTSGTANFQRRTVWAEAR